MIQAALGGFLIGTAALLLYGGLGRIAGISGITFGMLEHGARNWRIPFLAGLVGGGWIIALAIGMPATPTVNTMIDAALLVIAGLLVGAGTRVGNGCTSGHGVCGLARLSVRSLVAVASFMAAGMMVATLLRLLP